ncbi:MAG: fumarylacetoacetate hydrolase family protein [Lentisphaeria bacterium]|nr:fumarylacetoacetate hydrolase family protein [Lentisphaeria bacterium]
MKICRYAFNGKISYGKIDGMVVKTLAGCPIGGDVVETGETIDLAEVKLLAPVAPPNILAIGLNYRAHARETGAAIPDHPVLFLKATSAVTHPGDPIILPGAAPDNVDYEAELAVVIGKTAKKVRVDEALDYVFGYTVGNDVSARDCQKVRDLQWARAKSFDTFCPLGPWIETDVDPGDLPISAKLNGEIMQASSTKDLIFTVAELIAHLSENITLHPGTVIMTGTPPGVGMALDPPRFLRAGDIIEVTIGGIGGISNPVVADG